MNRTQLTETGITVVILVLIYQFIVSLIQLVYNLFLRSLVNVPDASSIILGMIFPVAMYLAMIYLLAMCKKPIARWINRKDTAEQTEIITISVALVIHISLIILCFITLINELPTVIYWTIMLLSPKETYVSDEEYSFSGDIYTAPEMDYFFWQPILKTVFALLLLIFSKRIAAIRDKKKPVE